MLGIFSGDAIDVVWKFFTHDGESVERLDSLSYVSPLRRLDNCSYVSTYTASWV